MSKLIIGILASTNATDLQAVIEAIEAKKLDAKIACLVSNRENANALERARKHGIEAIFLNPKDFDSAESFDREIIQILDQRNVGLVLLIGYNKFLSTPFLNAFRNRAMNIHPSILPAFKGWYTEIYRNVMEYGCKVTGCTLFFISEEPDAGPIIAQKAVHVSENETTESLRKKVQKAEQETILRGIKLFAGGKLSVEGNIVRVKE